MLHPYSQRVREPKRLRGTRRWSRLGTGSRWRSHIPSLLHDSGWCGGRLRRRYCVGTKRLAGTGRPRPGQGSTGQTLSTARSDLATGMLWRYSGYAIRVTGRPFRRAGQAWLSNTSSIRHSGCVGTVANSVFNLMLGLSGCRLFPGRAGGAVPRHGPRRPCQAAAGPDVTCCLSRH